MLSVSTGNMEKMAIVLGLSTLILALMTFTSSRSFASLWNRFSPNLLENRIYKSYYRCHWIFWSGFAFILFIHISMGLLHVVLNSFTHDPDAYLHAYVVATGLVGLVVTGMIVTSCRSLLGALGIVFLKNPLSSGNYQRYYKFHSYFWIIFLAFIIGHYSFGYLHAGGLWPR